VSGQRPGCSTDSQGEPADSDRAGNGSYVATLKHHQPDPKTIVCQKLADKNSKISKTAV